MLLLQWFYCGTAPKLLDIHAILPAILNLIFPGSLIKHSNGR